MSFLRFFSPSRAFEPQRRPSSSSPTSGPSTPTSKWTSFDPLPQFTRSKQGITLHLQIPSLGAVFIPAPHLDLGTDDDDEENQPREDGVLNGSLQIFLPPGLGDRRVKAVRVFLRSEITLNLGKERARERDVLSERVVEVKDDVEEEPLMIREGIQR